MTNTHTTAALASQIPASIGDQELLDRFIARQDEAAFASLVERYGATIWRLCRRILQKDHDADDAYQAVFIVLSRKASSIRKGEAVGSWLYSVAYRIAIKARKSMQRQQILEKQAADIAGENPPWSEAALREMQQILDEEVYRLADKYRAPFVLCCLEGMSRSEASTELRWPEETVKARLAQARKLLQTRLARRGITLSAVLTAVALAQNTASAAAPAVLAVATGAGTPLSSAALVMAENFVGSMGLAKLKTAFAVLLAMTVTVAGAGLTAYHFGSVPQIPDAPPKTMVLNDVFKNPETFLAPSTPVMKAHDEQVLALALSPDGKRLVTAGARFTLPGQFMIWDVENQKELVRLRGVRGIRGVAFSPDGKTVACGVFGGVIQLRDAGTGKEHATLEGHTFGVNAVAYSADGNRIASAGLDRSVKLWDVKKRAEIQSFAGHTEMVFTVAYFRHGKAIISGGQDRTAKIWDIETGKVKFNLAGHTAAVEAVAVSPDDKTVATASWDTTVKLWNAQTGKEEAALQGEHAIYAVAFSHDGALLAGSTVVGSTLLWDVKTRKVVQRFEKHGSAIWGVAFTPDNKILATGSSDRTAKLWNVESGKEIATLTTAEQKRVQSLAYAPDGKSLAIAGEDKYVQVRDAASGNVRLVLRGHSDIVNCVVISPDGETVASAGNDKTIKLWNLATGKELRTLSGHTGSVLALAFSRDGKLASAGEDMLVHLWDLAGEKEPTKFKGHDDAVRALAFAPNGASLASGGDDRAIRFWTLGKAAPRILGGHTASVRALTFGPDGLLASAGDDGAVRLWDPNFKKGHRALHGHSGPVTALAFTPGGRALVSGGADRSAVVWDPITLKRRATLRGHNGAVTALAMHPQGYHLITGSDNATLLRWQGAMSEAPARTLKAGPNGVWFAQYSPANDRLATGGANNTGGAVTLWSRSLVPAQLPYPSLDGVFWDADFAPDGRTLAVARFTNVQLLDVASGMVLRTLPMNKPVRSVKFSPDRKYLAVTTGSAQEPDGPYEAKLFDAVTWKELAVMEGHKGIVLRPAFSPDGKTLATSASDRTTKLWDIPTGKLRATIDTRSAFAKGLLFLPDGTLVTSCWDKAIRFWDVETKTEKKKWDTGINMTTLALSPDGLLLAAAEHSSPGQGPAELKVWDIAVGKVVLTPKGHTGRILGLAFTPDGRGLLASGGKLNTFGEIHHWDVATGELRGAHNVPKQWLENVLVSSDGRRVASVATNVLRFWDLDFLHKERTWTAHGDAATCGLFADGGAKLVTAGGDKSIKIWDVRDARLLATLDGHTKPIRALALLPDGKTLASGGEDSIVKLWDLANAKETASLEGHTKFVYSLAASPDGMTLASGGGDERSPEPAEWILWNLQSRTQRKTFNGIEGAVLALAYSPDGKSLAASTAQGDLLDVATDTEVLRHRFKAANLRSLAFSPDGKLLAVGQGKAPTKADPGFSSVRVWDTATWKERAPLEKHRHLITQVTFSPDGQTIASASLDGTVKLHPIPAEAATKEVRAPESEPVAKVDTSIDLHVPFNGRPDNLPQMRFDGKHAKEWIHFEPTGLRITIPPGFPTADGYVGLYTGIIPNGDFEATVNYEILKLPDPADAGPETGVTLTALRAKPDVCIAGATRRVVENGGSNFAGWVTWFDRAGKPTKHEGKVIPTEAKTGRLRIRRTGGELYFYASKSPDEELTLLNQISIGELELDNLRLIGFAGGPRASLDARYWDLRIRTGSFLRPQAIRPNSVNSQAPPDVDDPSASGSGSWLAALAILGCSFAFLFGVALFLRRRQATREVLSTAPNVRKPTSEIASIAFSCSCGKPLKAKAASAGKKLKCPKCGAPVLVPSNPSA